MAPLGFVAFIFGFLFMVGGFAIDPTLPVPNSFAPQVANMQMLAVQSNVIHAGGFLMVAGAALLAGAATADRRKTYESPSPPPREPRAHPLDAAVRTAE